MKLRRDQIVGILVVVANCIFVLPLGYIDPTANIGPYIVSFVRSRAIDPTDITNGEIMWLLAFLLLGRNSSVLVGGILARKFGTRFTGLIAAAIASAAYLIAPVSLLVSFWLCLLVFPFLFGIGVGIAQAPGIQASVSWFPRHTGIVSGIINSFFGVGGMITIKLQTAFINPSNLHPSNQEGTESITDFVYYRQKELLDRIPIYFVLHGIAILILHALTTPLLIEKHSNFESLEKLSFGKLLWKLFRPATCKSDYSNQSMCVEEKIIKDKTRNMNKVADIGEKNETPDKGPSQILLSKDFIFLFLSEVLITFGLYPPLSLTKVFGETISTDDGMLSIVGSLAALSCGFGMILIGVLSDKLPTKTVLVSMAGVITAVNFTFYASGQVGLLMYAVCILLLDFLSGGFISLNIVLLKELFGSKHATANYGLMCVGYSVSSFFAALTTSLLLPIIGWFGFYLLTGSLPFIGLLMLIFCVKTNKRKNNDVN